MANENTDPDQDPYQPRYGIVHHEDNGEDGENEAETSQENHRDAQDASGIEVLPEDATPPKTTVNGIEMAKANAVPSNKEPDP